MRSKSSPRRRTAAAAALALAVFALAAASPAVAFAQRFAVNGGATYARGLRATVGDAGWSPFFRPGVVVWDGGSIIAGYGADRGYRFPVQTLAVVPRTCASFVSSTGGARIADMLADAPVEVDARYDAGADLNLCLVLAGGGDLRAGASVASVFDAVGTYCRERRAAGFRVIVLTVLPSDRPETFDAARLAYNAMLRERWAEFADGLADIAADPRIGETGDELDRQFYGVDARHPNNAGNAVMAAVTAPVVAAQPWTSARCELRLRDLPGDWSAWRPYSAATTAQLGDYQGVHVVEAEYRLDGGEPVATADTIFVDTVRPVPRALRDVVVRRGRTAVLRYRIDDADPCGPTGTAVVSVTTARGRVVKTFVRRRVPVGQRATIAFTCTLPKGSYRYVVRARDAARNPELVPGTARLTVR
ncbi:MAG TPA: SGNH/GDSL hydrolase family protein [Thermoleophilia bacterium]|nr:SGNH/GDSL hydrolase family protein [Thermoleophilia bacterium]